MLVLWIDLDIGYVDNCALQDRPTRKEGPRWTRREYAAHLLEGFGGVVVLGDLVNQLAVEPIELAEESIAQPHGAPDDRVEDRLDICRRAADHPKDLARRRLLLEGLGNLRMSSGEGAVLLLQLLEQAHVLDGDHRLLGKRLKQGDLSSRE